LSDDPTTTDKGIIAINLLFEHNAKLQYCDKSILFWPVARGKYEIVKILLQKGASATFWPKDEIGVDITPIEEATQNGHKSIAELLVKYGAKKLDEKDSVQIRFIEVARHGSLNELIGLVKKGANVNTKNRQEKTALINALGGFFDYQTYMKISYLFDLGADVNLRGRGQFGITTPLHEAIFFSSFLYRPGGKRDRSYAEKVLQDLIKKGAFVSSRDENEKTPLHIAAENNHVYAAQMLLESGAKVMDKDKSGKTPLNYAESSEMMNLLKKHGAKEY
jgi:ankyrin repeat protein